MVKFNLKKKIAKALVFAMVMGSIGVQNLTAVPMVSVKAEEPTPPTPAASVTIDFENYTAIIKTSSKTVTSATLTKTDQRYVFLEVLKSKDATNPKVSATYSYPVGMIEVAEKSSTSSTTTSTKKYLGVIVDLSFLKATKDQYIRVYCDRNTTPTDIIEIKAQTKKPTIKYDAATNKLVDKEGKAISVASYSYKSLYGSNWKVLDENSLNNLDIAGTTILVRQNAIAYAAGNASTEAKGSPASTEVKVKIAAIPKAPKVKVDYVKGTVTIPKDTQVAVLKADGITTVGENDWNTHSKATTYTLEELAEKYVPVAEKDKNTKNDDTVKGYILVVRSKANGKKAASAPAFVTIAPAVVLTADKNAPKVTKPGEGGTGTVDVVTYEGTTKGIKITASSEAIEYSVDDGGKWTTIAANATKEIKAENGAEIKVRIAGTKAQGTVKETFPSKAATIVCKTVAAEISLEAKKTEVQLPSTSPNTIDISVIILDGNGTDITENYLSNIGTAASPKYALDEGNVKYSSSSSSSIAVTVPTSSTASAEKKGKLIATVQSNAVAGDVTIEVTIDSVKKDVKITLLAAPTTQQ